MKIVGLEEHFAPPEIMAAWEALTPELQDFALPQSKIGDILIIVFRLLVRRQTHYPSVLRANRGIGLF